MKAEKRAYWATLLTDYYAAVIVKMLLWVHRNGGFANPDRHMGRLTFVTLRSATAHAAILLALMVVLNLRQERRNSAAASQNRHKVAI